MNKKERIDKLNGEKLHSSRKNFGMFGNIQWAVTDIVDEKLIVRVSSSRDDFGKTTKDGGKIPDKKQIADNIVKSIRDTIKEVAVDVIWEDWKPGHGYGFLISINDKENSGDTNGLSAKQWWQQELKSRK